MMLFFAKFSLNRAQEKQGECSSSKQPNPLGFLNVTKQPLHIQYMNILVIIGNIVKLEVRLQKYAIMKRLLTK